MTSDAAAQAYPAPPPQAPKEEGPPPPPGAPEQTPRKPSRDRRFVVVGVLTVVIGGILIAAVAGAAQTNDNLGGAGTSASDTPTQLRNVEWSGTDSDGYDTGFVLNDDGGVEFSFEGETYLDSADSWKLDGSRLTIRIKYPDDDAFYEGDYVAGRGSIDLSGTRADTGWTLTVDREPFHSTQ
jgi:hypothetical protein